MLMAITAGCATSPGGIAPSTKPLTPGSYTVLGDVKGVDCEYFLFGLLPITGSNTLREAMADALKDKKGADALVEVTAEGYWEFWLLWTMKCSEVHGKAVQSH